MHPSIRRACVPADASEYAKLHVRLPAVRYRPAHGVLAAAISARAKPRVASLIGARSPITEPVHRRQLLPRRHRACVGDGGDGADGCGGDGEAGGGGGAGGGVGGGGDGEGGDDDGDGVDDVDDAKRGAGDGGEGVGVVECAAGGESSGGDGGDKRGGTAATHSASCPMSHTRLRLPIARACSVGHSRTTLS